MTYWALGCVGVAKKRKKGQKLLCVKLAICPDHPRRRRPLKFCMRGHVREFVIYFKFHENRSRGLRGVEGRKSASPIDLAHGLYNSLYYRTSRDHDLYGSTSRDHGSTDFHETWNITTSRTRPSMQNFRGRRQPGWYRKIVSLTHESFCPFFVSSPRPQVASLNTLQRAICPYTSFWPR